MEKGSKIINDKLDAFENQLKEVKQRITKKEQEINILISKRSKAFRQLDAQYPFVGF